MLYTTITIKDTDYKCRLNAKGCVDLEKKFGKNPVMILADMATSNTYPKVEDLVTILHAALQPYNHKITLDETYELFDEFMDDGNTLIDFIPYILEIFQTSGLVPKEEEKEEGADDSKNA